MYNNYIYSSWLKGGAGNFTCTFCEKHGIQLEASSILKSGRQFGKVVAVQVKDNLEKLSVPFDMIEDVGIWGNKEMVFQSFKETGLLRWLIR